MKTTYLKHCKKCSKPFIAERRNRKAYCSKSCANSCTTSQRIVMEKSIYLDGWNKINAYVLGLIYSDGCLSYDKHSNRYRVTIALKDKDLMNKLRLLICPEKKLYEQNGCYSVITRNEFDIEFIKQIGITERKSNTLQFPEDIPKDMMPHFIRGYFDGDGSVFVSNTYKDKKYLSVKFTCGCKEFLSRFSQLFIDYNIHSTITKDNRKDTFYLNIHRQDDIQKFYSLIYTHLDTFWLSRKKEIFYSGNIVRPTEEIL